MKYLVPMCLFGIIAGLFFALGGVGETKPNMQVVYAWDAENEIWTSELNVWDGWSINPCKITYRYWENDARVSTTIANTSDETIEVDLGDGQIATIGAGSNLTHSYQIPLKGQTERILITKLETQSPGLQSQEQLVLKIQPRTKGV